MNTVDDIGYGREFAHFYDRIFPKDATAERTADVLAGMHPGNGPALEFGVGTGRIAIPLARRVGPVVGVDSSVEMLDRLRSDIAHTEVDVTPVHGDIRAYRDDTKYVLVYCVCATLSMLLDEAQQQAAIDAAAARLAPGGTLVVETHNRSGVLSMLADKQHTSFFVPYAEQGTGLRTQSTIGAEQRMWQVSHTWFDGEESYVGSELSRLTEPREVDEYARNAGLASQGHWSDWDGARYSSSATTFLAAYTRPR